MVTFVCGNQSVQLKNPEFGNTSTLQVRRVQRFSRNQDLIIYRDPSWSYFEDFDLEFAWVLDADAQRFRLFVQSTFGQLIEFTDHEGYPWPGLIMTPDLTVKKSGRFNNTFTVKFEVVFP